MYGHEVLMSLQTRAKFFRTHFLHCDVSDIGLKGARKFILWKTVGNTDRLLVSRQILTMLTFHLPYKVYFSP
jgi:hypothetical protein